MSALARFTGSDVELEDDITLVAMRRTAGALLNLESAGRSGPGRAAPILAFNVRSEQGNERDALARVAEALTGHGLTTDELDRIKTGVAEATMNAIEHGNRNQPDLPVDVEVRVEAGDVIVDVTDRGGAGDPVGPTHPDLELKLAGLQTPRGWGLFLIESLVDEVEQVTEGDRHTVRLIVHIGSPPDSADGSTPEIHDA
jgi:anti-sigma regulatory factor (Ser/Thr protein kinase)